MKTMERNPRILVLGMGNEILADDSIGPRLIRDLKRLHPYLPVAFHCSALGGLEVLDLIRNYDHVLIIDSIKTGSGEIGDVYLFEPEAFMETQNLSNLHDISFLTAFELGCKLGIDMPTAMRIIAIEILENRLFTEDLTPLLELRYPEILQEVSHFLIHDFIPAVGQKPLISA